ncbi:MAG TPA: phage holin family protein [Polyangiaceae bacterium]|nr:phage holin family protein [Polyangiaceae bacterium]
MAQSSTFSTAMQPVRVGDERSLGDLVTELARETNTLVSKEVQLAKVELSQKVSHVGKSAGVIGAGAVLALVGLTLVAAAIAIALAAVLPLWLSSLLVGGALVAVGGVMAKGGLTALKHVDPVPRQTVETLKEDARWAKEQVR